MQVDFFEAPCNKEDGNCKKNGIVCKTITNKSEFGICEEIEQRLPCFINAENKETWIAVVENIENKEVVFKAIDFCVDAKRANNANELIKRCEGMLVFDNTIIFVELKIRKYSGWLKDACDKLIETIQAFQLNHGNEKIIVAYISNKLVPSSSSNHQIQRQRVKDTIGILPIVDRIIKIRTAVSADF